MRARSAGAGPPTGVPGLGMPHLPRELVATLGALELPHALVPADVDAQLFHGCGGKRGPVGCGPALSPQRRQAAARSGAGFQRAAQKRKAPAITFEGLAADLAEVGPPLLVPAGNVPQQRPLLGEALLAELAAEGTLPGVRPVVLVQARCRRQGERGGSHSSAARHVPPATPQRCQAGQAGSEEPEENPLLRLTLARKTPPLLPVLYCEGKGGSGNAPSPAPARAGGSVALLPGTSGQEKVGLAVRRLGAALSPAVPCVRKVLPQRWHWKGFSPVCVRRCMLRLAFCVKAWWQNSHT